MNQTTQALIARLVQEGVPFCWDGKQVLVRTTDRQVCAGWLNDLLQSQEPDWNRLKNMKKVTTEPAKPTSLVDWLNALELRLLKKAHKQPPTPKSKV